MLEKAAGYLPADKVEVVENALSFAEKAHDGQKRLSGEPFVEHPLQTALFLADLRLDSDALAAALLHDVIEDCDVPYGVLEENFGSKVATLVDGVTKLTQTELLPDVAEPRTAKRRSKGDLAHAATVRKMLMSMAEDIRVVLIKLSDRLHNMRTLDALPERRRVVIAQETLDIYAPLAHRLGIWEMKWLLEDLAFQHLNPTAYRDISKLLNAKREAREDYVERVIDLLRAELDRAGLEAQVTGRPKHIYSIYKKSSAYAEQNKTTGEIFDLFALRVLVDDVSECYSALGVVHAKWHPLPGQFDDYIATPKDNLYRSLHTAVLCEDRFPVEVQIRTHEMHQLAEYGVAAHWLYKEGGAADRRFEEKMTWLRQLLEWQREVSGVVEYVESFKTDIFKNQVFVYTPRGDLKELPAGAGPLDFAYRIHTEVGHRCIGAKVNGKLVSLQSELQNGDTVEIMTSKTMRGPSRDWVNSNLGYLKTGSAREKVRQWFNRQARKTNIQQGKEVFHKQLRRLDSALEVADVAKVMNFATADEFFEALGSGTISTVQVVNSLPSQEVAPEPEVVQALPGAGPVTGIEVLGVGDLLTRMARCCTPIRGDDIIGYITRNRGVTVHLESCANVTNESELDRLVEVSWGKTKTVYPVGLRVEALDRVGLLSDVTSVVSAENVNIISCVSEKDDDISMITVAVHIHGIEQLNRLCLKLEGVEGVMHVLRVNNDGAVPVTRGAAARPVRQSQGVF